MKSMFFSTIFILLIGVGTSFGQVYENVYENSNSEVQAKLNQNKIAGIDILTGVVAQHEFEISGMDNSKKIELVNVLTNHQQITNYSINEELTRLVFRSSAHFTKDKATTLLNPLNLTVTEYTVVYSVAD